MMDLQKLELCRVSDVWNQLMERSGFVERLASVHRCVHVCVSVYECVSARFYPSVKT